METARVLLAYFEAAWHDAESKGLCDAWGGAQCRRLWWRRLHHGRPDPWEWIVMEANRMPVAEPLQRIGTEREPG